MAEINGTVGGSAPPIAIVVRKVGETTGNRCIGSCNAFPVDFTQDSGTHQYYFIVTDSNGCTVDSRLIQNGVGTINCDVTQPTFDATFTQPVCIEGGYQPGVIHLTNLLNATRYKICYNTVTMNCAACTESDGVISGSTLNITVDTPTTPTSRGVLLRVYNGSGCEAYNEYFTTMITPSCEASALPEFTAAKLQPYCPGEEGSSVQNAILQLTEITNATRYKICYNSSTFSSSCNASCSISDGTIVGTTKDIVITAPAQGVSQTNTIRIYNGSSCNYYRDVVFAVNSPNCANYSMINLDVQVFSYTATCNNESTYPTTYDMYMTPNATGLESINGVRAKIGNTGERNLPNGNDTPNVYISAGFKASCSPGTLAPAETSSIFYRFSINMSNLKANFPSVNLFSFDVFANRTKNSGVIQENLFRVVRNGFKSVRMLKQLYSNGSADAIRDPSKIGTNASIDSFYNPTITGFRKIGTLTFNYTTNSLVWTPT